MSDETKSADESAKHSSGPDADGGTADSAPATAPAGDKKAKRAERRERSAERKQRTKNAGAKVKKGSDAIRNRVASVIWLIAVVCALFLAVGALLIALEANQANSIVTFVLDGADRLDGPFSRDNGLFTFEGNNAETKSALVNWGLAAVAYLVAGKIVDRIIRP